MKPSLFTILKARRALWHTRQAKDHMLRGERLLFDDASIWAEDVETVAGLLAFACALG